MGRDTVLVGTLVAVVLAVVAPIAITAGPSRPENVSAQAFGRIRLRPEYGTCEVSRFESPARLPKGLPFV